MQVPFTLVFTKIDKRKKKLPSPAANIKEFCDKLLEVGPVCISCLPMPCCISAAPEIVSDLPQDMFQLVSDLARNRRMDDKAGRRVLNDAFHRTWVHRLTDQPGSCCFHVALASHCELRLPRATSRKEACVCVRACVCACVCLRKKTASTRHNIIECK